MDGVAQVRSFNRTVTERVGALQDSFLARGRPLGASRVLWEIGDGTDARALRERLGLDSGYLSRLLRGLEQEGLIAIEPEPDDRRVRRVSRTAAGHAEVAELDRRSDALASSLLAPLGDHQQHDLVEAMARVERLLTAGLVEVTVEPPTSDAARFCLESYFKELNRRFDAGFDPAVSVVADPAELTEPEGVLLVARLRGEPVGNGALRFQRTGPRSSGCGSPTASAASASAAGSWPSSRRTRAARRPRSGSKPTGHFARRSRSTDPPVTPRSSASAPSRTPTTGSRNFYYFCL